MMGWIALAITGTILFILGIFIGTHDFGDVQEPPSFEEFKKQNLL